MRAKIVSMALCFALVCAITQLGIVRAQDAQGSIDLLGAGLGALSGALCAPLGALCSIPLSLIVSLCAMPIQMIWSCITPVWVSIQSIVGTILGGICSIPIGLISGLCGGFMPLIAGIFEKVVAVLPLILGIFEPVLMWLQEAGLGAAWAYVRGWVYYLAGAAISAINLLVANFIHIILYGIILIPACIPCVNICTGIPTGIFMYLIDLWVTMPAWGLSVAGGVILQLFNNKPNTLLMKCSLFPPLSAAIVLSGAVVVVMMILMLLMPLTFWMPIIGNIAAIITWILCVIIAVVLDLLLVILESLLWYIPALIPTCLNYEPLKVLGIGGIKGGIKAIEQTCFNLAKACGAWIA